MDISDLSSAEQEALASAIRYWSEHWDWECRTLFGLEREDMADIAARLPLTASERGAATALAIIGAVRELLYGASALSPSKTLVLVGMTAEDLGALLNRIRPRIDAAMGG